MLAANGMNLTRSFCYWPDFHPEPDRLDERMLERFADFLDRHTEAGMGTVPTFIVGHMSGENWDPAWRQGRDLYGDVWMVARQAVVRAPGHRAVRRPPGGGRVAAVQRDAAVRRPGPGAGRHRLGGAAGAGRPGRGRHPAGVAGGRRLGHRDERGRQRLLGAGHRAAGRLRRPPRLPDGDRPGPAAPGAGLRLRAGRLRRQAGGAGGVRRQHRLLLGRERRPLLPPGAAHQPAGRGQRLDRLEQHRLRPPGRPGPLPPPPLRDALRADRRTPAPPSPTWPRSAPSPSCWRRSTSRPGPPAGRGRPGGAVLPGARLPVHRARGPHLRARLAPPGVRGRLGGRRGRPADARARRPRAGRPPLPGPVHQAAHRPGMAGPGALRRRRRRRLRLLLRRRARRPARPLVRRPGPDVRRRAAAHPRTRRPHRG